MFGKVSHSQKRFAPALSIVLAGTLVVAMMPASLSFGFGSAFAAEPTVKDETVYVKTSADGEVEALYVVNRFAAGEGAVIDPGEYLSVTNLTTSAALNQTSAGTEVMLQEGMPVYYEGELDAATALPWDVSLTYWLDGVQVKAADLGGASGDVRIELSVVAHTDAAEAGIADFAKVYVLQAQGNFNASTFEFGNTQGAMIAQVGGESIVSCMVLPGESKTFVMEGSARNFESSGWQISALPLELAIEIANEDTSALTDATSALEQATGSLASGSGQLPDGSGALSQGIASAINGTNALSEGADQLANGAEALQEGAETLAQGMTELDAAGDDLLSGWESINSGANSLASGAASLSDGNSQYQSALESAKEEVATIAKSHETSLQLYQIALNRYTNDPTEANKGLLDQALQLVIATSQATGAQQALQQALEGYSDLSDGIDSVSNGASSLASGTNEFDAYLQQYVTAVGTASEGAEELAQGASTLNEGMQSLPDGVSELKAGLGTLGTGAKKLTDGAEKLAGGAQELADAVQGMDTQILDALQNAIDSKLGVDFAPHSFVAPDNTQVNSVQFVYVVDGISADGAEPVEDSSANTDELAEEPGLIDRILGFLKRLFSGSEG